MNIGLAFTYGLFASVKFLIAPLFGFKSGFSLEETILIMFLGGSFGVVVFYYTANFFLERARLKRIKKIEIFLSTGEGKLPKVFNKKNKMIVRLKQKLGLYGVVFIALPIISLPIEGIVCAKFFKHKRALVPLLIISTGIWSILLTLFYNSFYTQLVEWFNNLW